MLRIIWVINYKEFTYKNLKISVIKMFRYQKKCYFYLKDKLSGSNKVQVSNRRLYSGNHSSDHLRTAELPELLSVQPTIYNTALYPFDENILFTMSSEQRRQILKMKEQIESQNRVCIRFCKN